MFLTYNLTIWGLWFIALTVFAQGFVATIAHRRQSDMVPGKLNDSLSHNSFVFRSHRTFHNSLENLPTFFIPALLAMFIGVEPAVLAWVVWIFALSRFAHMMLYYIIATEKNPSPRSFFYLIGWLVNLVLFGLVAVTLL